MNSLADDPTILEEPDSWEAFYNGLSDEKRLEFAKMAAQVDGLAPMPGPQTDSFLSEAKIVGAGGAGGGGKTMLIILLAILRHRHSVVFRYDKAQLSGLINELIRIRKGTDGLNRQEGVFRFDSDHYLQFGGLGKPNEEENWQGIAHDLKAYDEVTQLPLDKVEYTMGWLRTVIPGLLPKVLMTFNPPRRPIGRWVIPYFGPWLDKAHEDYPAAPGRLYWYHRDEDGELIEHTQDPGPIVLTLGGQRIEVAAESKTFFPARVWHNKYLVAAGYQSHLASRPKEERDMLLLGDFQAAIQDDDYQLVPTQWIEDAMLRWDARDRRHWPMDALGVDVGTGQDRSVFTRRHGLWFDKQIADPGRDSTNESVAKKALEIQRDGARICVDSVGEGAATYALLNAVHKCNPAGVKGSWRKNLPKNIEGDRKFRNMRSVLAWTLRRLLDPGNGLDVALPPSPKLRDEIVAHHYQEIGELTAVEPKDSVKTTLKHSPDLFDSVIYSLYPIAMRDEDIAARVYPPKKPGRIVTDLAVRVKKSRIFNPYQYLHTR